ncbi:MAG: ABC transporter permease [Gammaproteobacteria bacterium]|nr:ABC transporter permease [Gammaproteobacteria bacterium]
MLWQLLQATLETLYMTLLASFFAMIIGFPIGALLFLTRKHQLLANKTLNQSLGIIVNIGRSIPFVILMVAVIPLTRFVTGTSIGTSAAIVPLAIAAIPFFARMIENAFLEVSPELVEAALSMGATLRQIIFKVLLPEAMPGITNCITITIVTLLGYSAMAGAIGGGGLGDLAIRYGYQRFDTTVMIETIVILVAMVQLVQMLGDYCVKRLSHR